MSVIADYYLQKVPDHAGRYLVDIWGQSDEYLEKSHDYIQWMFPNREPSPVNPKAPILTDEVVEEFKSDSHLISQVRTSLNRMIRFFEMDEENPWWCTKNNHNYLRCTRIINTLREFGMVAELAEFYDKLLTIADNNEVINGITLSYWADAFEGQQEYLIEVTAKAEFVATRSVDVRASSLKEAKAIASKEVRDNMECVFNSKDYYMDVTDLTINYIKAEEE